ncbi:MAG: GNAT family N-acetyltransferase [Actinobacteria bacterium HGW-Actinobacteria-6]|jgi:ribosomal protein S18 acetylase RimI-like enzyme|nr:MAG: GNAT family N-acetyltransferase [Actinobacteria bacterium HGW-Actinobacteria-6]
MNGLSLRPTTEADLEFMHTVYASGRAEELAPVPWTPEQKTEFLRQQSEAQLAYYTEHYPHAEHSIVVLDGVDIGRLLVEHRDEDLRLMDMGLLPGYRGRGVGTELVNSVVERAETIGLPVVLHVESFNPAKRLYERLGFIDDGEVGAYRRMFLPCAVMA